MGYGVIRHYASPYYDPVKAHEYYEEHKKLKGRTSTAGLNDTGKEAARYVKNSLNEERKQKVEESKNQMNSKIASSKNAKDSRVESAKAQTKARIEQHKNSMQNSIDGLSEKLKKLTSAEKKGPKGLSIRNDIAKLREKNTQKRKELQAEYSENAKSYRSEHSTNVKGYREEHKQNVANYRSEYNSKYEAELEKMQNDSSMKKVYKRKRR